MATQSAKKEPIKYNVEMDTKSFAIFVLLSLVTAAIVFYLGVIFGKAIRDPDDLAFQQKNITNRQLTDTQNSKKKNLAVFNMTDLNAKKKNPIKKNTQTNQNTNTQKKTTTQTQQNTQVLPKHFYTIQVFATGNRKKATNIVNGLKKDKFDAYVQTDNNKLFRVRVGRIGTKDLAERVKVQLQASASGLGKMKVLQIKKK
ncbi:MAG: cell division septation protein DedD [bacterium]|jgi:cell division septation protein DedD